MVGRCLLLVLLLFALCCLLLLAACYQNTLLTLDPKMDCKNSIGRPSSGILLYSQHSISTPRHIFMHSISVLVCLLRTATRCSHCARCACTVSLRAECCMDQILLVAEPRSTAPIT